MAPLRNDVSRLETSRVWNDGFVIQRLLGLMVAALLTGTILGGKALVAMIG